MASGVIKRNKLVSYTTQITTNENGYAYINDDLIAIHLGENGYTQPLILMPRQMSNYIVVYVHSYVEETAIKILSANTTYTVRCFKYA